MSETKAYLDPANEAALELLPSTPLEELSIKQFRQFFERAQQHDQLPGVQRKKVVIPVEDGVTVWIYRPEGTGDDLPYLFYIHGGGWISGSIRSYDSIATDLVLRTGFALVFPEYSLAPEVTFPTQHNECFGVLEWMTKHGKKHNLQPKNFAVLGDSAGGHITAGLNIMAIQRKPRLTIPFNILISPVTDTDVSGKPTLSEFQFFSGPFLTLPLLRQTMEAAFPEEDDRQTAIGSPRNMPDEIAKRFPPTMIVVSSADVLRTEGELMAEKLQRNGVECSVVEGFGQLHDSVIIDAVRGSATPRALMGMISGELRERLGGSGVTEKKRKRRD